MKIQYLKDPVKCPNHSVDEHENGITLFSQWYDLKRGDKVPELEDHIIIGFYRHLNNHISAAFGKDLNTIQGWVKIPKQVAKQS